MSKLRALPYSELAETEVDQTLIQVPRWNEIPWLRHGFSTRSGGVSTVYLPQHLQEQSTGEDEPEDLLHGDLNLGLTKDDHPEFVAENRRRLVAAATGSADNPLITVRQIHSATSLVVADPISHTPSGLLSTEGHAMRQGDGLMTRATNVLLGIQTADCVPVLVVDPENRAVAAFHAGWRGTVARIVEHGIARMVAEYHSRPQSLMAAIGPSIGACCYTVGEQVHEEFAAAFDYADTLFSQGSSAGNGTHRPAGSSRQQPIHLDLWEANRRQLLQSGILASNITVLGECSGCAGLPEARRYFSHRCEHGFTGRMMGVVGIFDS